MMIGYGKSTQTSIAALSLLAQVYDGGATRLSASDIAAARNLQRPFVAKLLTVLAQARLVTGSPGPGGGYALARPPEEITIYHVATLFEREDENICPLGKGRCGNGEPCPLHAALLGLNDSIRRMLEGLTLDIFRVSAPAPLPPPQQPEVVPVHAE
jgi:Rrf2 family protein